MKEELTRRHRGTKGRRKEGGGRRHEEGERRKEEEALTEAQRHKGKKGLGTGEWGGRVLTEASNRRTGGPRFAGTQRTRRAATGFEAARIPH